MQHAADLLKAILQADDRGAAVRQHLDEIDETFFTVLSANIQRAEAENRKDLASALTQVADLTLSLLEDQLPPEVRLINQLLQASYPDGTRQLLETQREIVTTEFIAALDQIISELERASNADAANHVRQVKSQAELITQRILQP
jgi:hypothetical protein